MSDQESLDISKVVSLIMENPALIEQISSLAKSSRKTQSEEPPDEVIDEKSEVELKASTEPTSAAGKSQRKDRATLLCALKPYVSSERAKAIDSMISIADILDMMRSR